MREQNEGAKKNVLGLYVMFVVYFLQTAYF